MNLTSKTIQTFLLGGDSRGIRIADTTTRIVQVIEVPRSLSAIDGDLKATTDRILTMIGGLTQ